MAEKAYFRRHHHNPPSVQYAPGRSIRQINEAKLSWEGIFGSTDNVRLLIGGNRLQWRLNLTIPFPPLIFLLMLFFCREGSRISASQKQVKDSA